MSPASLQSAQEAREEIEKVSSLVLAARRLMAKGALVDLFAIQERVAAICAAVDSMPREDGQALMEDLTGLIHRLDRLSSDISDQLFQMNGKPDGEG